MIAVAPAPGVRWSLLPLFLPPARPKAPASRNALQTLREVLCVGNLPRATGLLSLCEKWSLGVQYALRIRGDQPTAAEIKCEDNLLKMLA